MSHAHGTHLGGVRDLEDMRQRCVIYVEGGCWHMRDGHGQPLSHDGATHRIHLYGRGVISALRAAWELAGNDPPPPGHIVYRTCASYDCILHLACGTRAEHGAHLRRMGTHRQNPTRRASNARTARTSRRARLTPELAQWVRESTQSLPKLSAALGIPETTLWAARAGKTWQETAG